MPEVMGLVEAALFVKELRTARDFYRRVLGLETLQESRDGCVFAAGDGRVLLLVSEEKARIPSGTPGGVVPPSLVGPGASSGAGHIAFGVDEGQLDAWRVRLVREGVEVLSEVAWEEGARSLYFRDPDGHLVELVTPGLWGPGRP